MVNGRHMPLSFDKMEELIQTMEYCVDPSCSSG